MKPKEKQIEHLKQLLIKYQRGGEGLTTVAIRNNIKKLENEGNTNKNN